MKVNQVSILVSKKVGRNFCSWSLSYGATAEVEDEHFTDVISQLDNQLKEMVSKSLPTPNGNGNGKHLPPQRWADHGGLPGGRYMAIWKTKWGWRADFMLNAERIMA